jgi:3-deoxy-D-manno-octulosonic-acid transferase
VLHGPHVSSFRDVYAALAAAKAVVPLEDGAALAVTVKRLIDDPNERQRLSREAFACVERFTGALERTLAALEPYLAPLAHADEAEPRA